MPPTEICKSTGDESVTIVSTAQTADELLKMLTGKSNNSRSASKPPPIPPKPRQSIMDNITTRATSIASATSRADDIVERSFRTYSAGKSRLQNSANSNSVTYSFVDRGKNNGAISSSGAEKYDAYNSGNGAISMQHNNNDRNRVDQIHRQAQPLLLKTSNITVNYPPGQQTAPSQFRTTPGEKASHAQTSATITTTPWTDYPDSSRRIPPSASNVSHSVGPIVTESPEETNNNSIARDNRIRAKNTSTVEILEIPFKSNEFTRSAKEPKRTSADETVAARVAHTYYSLTFDRSPKRPQEQDKLFYENNTYAIPVITPATDDEAGELSYNDGIDQIVSGDDEPHHVVLPTEKEVESILNESSMDQPPRTSTPNTSLQSHANSRSVASLNARIAAIANTSSRGSYTSNLQAKPTTSEEEDDDIENFCIQRVADDQDFADESKETDEITNTSALNQSGGCELIGVYDNSDRSGSAKNSPRILVGQQNQQETTKMPYSVQAFNETTSSPLVSPADRSGRQTDTEGAHSPCQDKIKELERVNNSLLDYVDKLKAQIEKLTYKVESLEVQVNKQQENILDTTSSRRPENASSCSIMNLSSRNPDTYKGSTSKQSYSISTPGINRLDGNHGANSSAMSTYSRSNVATISRYNSNNSPNYSSPNGGGLVMSGSRFGLSVSQSGNNTASKPLKRNNVHASTNSLYTDSFKSGSASISPTPNNHLMSHRQSTSPTSMLGSTNRRNHMSMLSLSSLGPSNSSTLKRGSAITGSVSNLSQVGSQLSNWPSLSNFVTNTHQAKDILYDDEDRLIRMVLYNTLITMRVPNWAGSNYNLNRVIEPPSVKLKLDWVYGYRGRDCRSNIFYLPTGECVYFVASIVVLYNPEEKTQRHYLGHTDSVKCLAVHPNRLIIASGQSAVQKRRDRRPIVRVWNTVSLATLRVIGFNEDFDRSICCLAFSKHDQGVTLVVVDESSEHTITLLDWQREKNWRLAETNSGHEAVLAIDFHPIDKYSLVAVGKGSVNFWDIRGMTLTKKAGLFDKYDKPKYVLCLTFNDLGDTITGDSNGNVIVWPRGSNRPRKIIHDAHQGGVFSVLAMKDGTYLTGGRDRRIVEWDENFNRTGREAALPEHCGGIRYITYARGSQVLIGTLRNTILLGSLDKNFVLIMQGHTEATTALAIHPSQNRYLTGGFDDQIHLFDSKTHDVVWSKCIAMPATAASFSPNGQLLLIGSTLGKWLVIDTMSQEILFTKCDGSGTFNCIKFSPSGELFCMGSGDAHIYVYEISEGGSKFCPIGTCAGHSGPVKEIDWSADGQYFQSQSMNFELLFWKAQNCRPLEDAELIDDIRWNSHNCTLGFSAIGIWSDSIDSALINYCDRSNNNDLMVSVTDTGSINTFKWPTCYNQCLPQQYYGIVEKFNFIKFLPDDSRLIAVGAKNCVTTEWIVEKVDAFDMS